MVWMPVRARPVLWMVREPGPVGSRIWGSCQPLSASRKSIWPLTGNPNRPTAWVTVSRTSSPAPTSSGVIKVWPVTSVNMALRWSSLPTR